MQLRRKLKVKTRAETLLARLQRICHADRIVALGV
jgi:hypothetical protein